MFLIRLSKKDVKILPKTFNQPLKEFGLYHVGVTQERMVKTEPTHILVPSFIGTKVNRKLPDPPNQKSYTYADRAKGIKGQISGKQPLVSTGKLRNSITSKSGTMSVQMGTNVEYAEINQIGGKSIITEAQRDEWLKRYGIRVKTKEINITARPYLFFTEEDFDVMYELLADYIMRSN